MTQRRIKVLYLADVKGWAWWWKGQTLRQYLADEFDIIVIPMLQERKGFDVREFDLYFTLGWQMAHSLHDVPENRRITGVTAHKTPEFFNSTILPAMRTCRWVHANSILLKNELEANGIPDVFYVPNGVDETKFRVVVPIPEKRDNLVVGHVGKKCGSGTDAKGHKRFIEPSTAKAGVIYRGHYNTYKNAIPNDKMYTFYNEIDCYIVSSETDGTPNGALEAAACGRPIISNRIGNMPEFIRDGYNGFLVDRTIDAYVDKLKYFKENRDKLIEMGQNARKTVEEAWTWRIMSENYRKMFKSIIGVVGLRQS